MHTHACMYEMRRRKWPAGRQDDWSNFFACVCVCALLNFKVNTQGYTQLWSTHRIASHRTYALTHSRISRFQLYPLQWHRPQTSSSELLCSAFKFRQFVCPITFPGIVNEKFATDIWGRWQIPREEKWSVRFLSHFSTRLIRDGWGALKLLLGSTTVLLESKVQWEEWNSKFATGISF